MAVVSAHHHLYLFLRSHHHCYTRRRRRMFSPSGSGRTCEKTSSARPHHWRDSAGGTPSPQGGQLPDPGPGLTPSWTGFAYSDHAWNRPGGRPKSHFATPQASSSPPVLTGHGETLRPRSTATATTARHRATVHSHRRSRLRHHPPPLPLKRLAGR